MYKEKTIESNDIYKGKIINLKVDKVLLPNGNESTREIVTHSGASAIVALKGNNIIFVKQYRKPIEKHIIEIPAGKLDENEKPKDCAKRELQEETGYIAEDIIELGDIFTTPGFSNEIIHIFFSKNLTMGIINRDPDEFMDVIEIPLEEVKKMVLSNKIKDSKTLSALLMALQYLNI